VDRGGFNQPLDRTDVGRTPNVHLTDQELPPTDRSWSKSVEEKPNELLTNPFIYVIGLYSRHGFFYPPYLPFPDVNVLQLKANWTDR
jgi:hypothetical protein